VPMLLKSSNQLWEINPITAGGHIPGTLFASINKHKNASVRAIVAQIIGTKLIFQCVFRRSWPPNPGKLATPRSEATLGCFYNHLSGQHQSRNTKLR